MLGSRVRAPEGVRKRKIERSSFFRTRVLPIPPNPLSVKGALFVGYGTLSTLREREGLSRKFQWRSKKNHAKIVAKRNIKNGMSATPLN